MINKQKIKKIMIKLIKRLYSSDRKKVRKIEIIMYDLMYIMLLDQIRDIQSFILFIYLYKIYQIIQKINLYISNSLINIDILIYKYQ